MHLEVLVHDQMSKENTKECVSISKYWKNTRMEGVDSVLRDMMFGWKQGTVLPRQTKERHAVLGTRNGQYVTQSCPSFCFHCSQSKYDKLKALGKPSSSSLISVRVIANETSESKSVLLQCSEGDTAIKHYLNHSYGQYENTLLIYR